MGNISIIAGHACSDIRLRAGPAGLCRCQSLQGECLEGKKEDRKEHVCQRYIAVKQQTSVKIG